jgi:hypothetical protein
MVSNIQPDDPISGDPTTQSVRDNFQAAADEITALQAAFDAAPWLPLSGGTLTGNLTIGVYAVIKGTGAQPAQLFLDTDAGGQRLIAGRSAGSARWGIFLGDQTAESGSNAGANFILSRYSDAGGYLGNPLVINRATGAIDFAIAPTIAGSPLSFLPLAGGSLTGDLILAGDPTQPLQAATRQFVEAHIATAGGAYLPLAGGTLAGDLILNRPPIAPLQAATKAYADRMLPLAGGTLTGDLFLNGDPVAPTQAATMGYVNSRVAGVAAAYLLLTGGTLTGPVVLAADPSQPLQAATRRYTDTKLALAGGTLTGPLVLAGDPTAPLQPATRAYADRMLPLAGGTMTGPLALVGDPVLPAQASTKAYADTKLALAGGTLTGDLILNRDPVAALQAATRQYVETRVATLTGAYLPMAGGTMTGPLTDAGGDIFDASDPRLGTLAYYWQDPTQQIAGGVAVNGTLLWSQAQINSLVATAATIQTATIAGGTATLSTLAATASITTPSLTVSTTFNFSGPLSGTQMSVGGDIWLPLDPRYPSMTYAWLDAVGAVAGGVTADGTLSWSTIRANAATFLSLTTSGALSAPSLVVSDATFAALDPRIPGAQYAWIDPTGAVNAAIATDGTFQISVATVTTSLSLGFDATQPNHALRKSYADAAYIPTTGGTMTGMLVLPAAWPTSPNQAANKSYVDSHSGGGGGSGTYPVPALRDPRQYGAAGDGVTDDSTALNNCVAAATAAGERLIAVNNPLYVPGMLVAANAVHFVGSGSLIGNKPYKYVVPPFAPAPPRVFTQTLTARKHCPTLAVSIKATGTGVCVLTGDSYSAPTTNGFTSSAVLWSRLRRVVDFANPGAVISWYNRGIGGQTWGNLAPTGMPTSTAFSWYTDPLRPWLQYIKDLAPDVVFVNFASNDGSQFRLSQLNAVRAEMASWPKPPDLVLVTSNPYSYLYTVAGGSPTPADNAKAQYEGQSYCAEFERTYAIAHGLGLIDTWRAVVMARMGVDVADLPLMRDYTVTGGTPTTSRVAINLPFTWPVACGGYGGWFFVPANGWAALGNELRFDLGSQTLNTANSGNVFRVGRDTASGNVYWQADVTQTASGAEQTEVFIPKRIIASWPAGTGNFAFQWSCSGPQVIFQGTNTGSAGDHWTDSFMGCVPRFGVPNWRPRITAASGAVTAGLYFDRSYDGYACAMTANPHARTLYMPTLTDYEAAGSNASTGTTGSPDMSPWGGGGIGHASVLHGITAIESALESCDFACT